MKNKLPTSNELDAMLAHCLGRCKHLRLQRNKDDSISYFCRSICELKFNGVNHSEYIHGRKIKTMTIKE